jgi:hypothetical protein
MYKNTQMIVLLQTKRQLITCCVIMMAMLSFCLVAIVFIKKTKKKFVQKNV